MSADLKTLIANLRHGARNKQAASIGGGEFSPAEQRELSDQLEQVLWMLEALSGDLAMDLATDPPSAHRLVRSGNRLEDAAAVLARAGGAA
jgi:hypothetical protein